MRVLTDLGHPATPCADVGELCARFDDDTLMMIIAEEAFARGAGSLAQCVETQPPWSDIPILLLSVGGPQRGGDARWHLFERLGNVVMLDRPLHIRALQSAVGSALRARARQHQVRALLEELAENSRDLERRVKERTRQLQEEMAERQAVEAALARAQRLEAVGKLTGGIAHDFNNLLQVVMSGLSMLERHSDKPARRATILDAMRQASERGAKLTQQLLAFSRRQGLTPRVIDVAAHVLDMQELLSGSVRADLRLEFRLAPDLWAVEVDSTQLEVALLNLVINARDATDSGGEIVVSAEKVTISEHEPIEGLAGEFVRLTVSDTGSGMDGETLRRAVEPFYTTKAPGTGTGLGLSQVYGFARQSGGGVQIDSEPGRGTSVSILLPRSYRPLQRRPAPATTPTYRHRGGRILVVEDEVRIAEFACSLLGELGYECEHVTTAEQALAIDLDHFDAVLSDVVMPGTIDGITLAQRLRERWPKLAIMLTTGFVDEPERVTQSGFPVLRKPYDFDQLSAALANLFGGKEA